MTRGFSISVAQRLRLNAVFSILLLVFLLLVGIMGCQKESLETPGNLYLIGVQNDSGSSIVKMQLNYQSDDSLVAPTIISVDCFHIGSTFFDPVSLGFGYVNCDSKLIFINSETWDTTYCYTLPNALAQLVLTSDGHELIGRYYDPEKKMNFITKINLTDGRILANHPVELYEGLYACTYFYRSTTGEYALVRSDSMMLFINPDNGVTNDSLKLNNSIKNVIYDAELDRIIGFSYSLETAKNYIEVLDLATGKIIIKTEIKLSNDYLACEASYDPETNSYILLNANDEILFLDIDSGKMTDSYSFMSHIREFKIWRGE